MMGEDLAPAVSVHRQHHLNAALMYSLDQHPNERLNPFRRLGVEILPLIDQKKQVGGGRLLGQNLLDNSAKAIGFIGYEALKERFCRFARFIFD